MRAPLRRIGIRMKNKVFLSIVALSLVFVMTASSCGKSKEPETEPYTVVEDYSEPDGATLISKDDATTAKTEETKTTKPATTATAAAKTDGNNENENRETTAKQTETAVKPTEAATKKPETTAKPETPRPEPGPDPTTQPPTTAASGSFGASDIKCTVNGVTVTPGTKWSLYEESLGAPDSTEQAPSCHFDGMDVIYGYDGFKIYTYQNDGESYVYDVEVSSPSIKSDKGVGVGSSADDVIAAYGEGYATRSESLIEYRSGSNAIYFSLEGGKVSLMEFETD